LDAACTSPSVRRQSGRRRAEAAAQIDAARLIFESDIGAPDRLTWRGQALTPGAAQRICYHTAFLIDACSEARDIHVMTQHATMDLDSRASSTATRYPRDEQGSSYVCFRPAYGYYSIVVSRKP
jgi:hypothetical protein